MLLKKKKHWYRMYVGECPVCGRDAGSRERVYGKKPKNLSRVYVQLSGRECYDYCLERG
jgi:hypothetical protein